MTKMLKIQFTSVSATRSNSSARLRICKEHNKTILFRYFRTKKEVPVCYAYSKARANNIRNIDRDKIAPITYFRETKRKKIVNLPFAAAAAA